MSLCSDLIKKYDPEINAVPSIQYIWDEAQPYVEKNDLKMIKKYQNLIFILHNSFVSPETRLGKGVKFGYGGIGVVLHKSSIVGDNVTISQNVTIGGTPGSQSIDKNGNSFNVPHIEDNVYISCGSKILGAVNIGRFSIVGANSVVLKNVDSFSIYVGSPAKKMKSLNKENCLKYRSFFSCSKQLNDEEYIGLFPN